MVSLLAAFGGTGASDGTTVAPGLPMIAVTASINWPSNLPGLLSLPKSSALGSATRVATSTSRQTSSMISPELSPSSPSSGVPARNPSWRNACWQNPWMVVMVASSNDDTAADSAFTRSRRSVSSGCDNTDIHSWSSGTSPLESEPNACTSTRRVRSRNSAAAARVNVTTSSDDAGSLCSATWRATSALRE